MLLNSHSHLLQLKLFFQTENKIFDEGKRDSFSFLIENKSLEKQTARMDIKKLLRKTIATKQLYSLTFKQHNPSTVIRSSSNSNLVQPSLYAKTGMAFNNNMFQINPASKYL